MWWNQRGICHRLVVVVVLKCRNLIRDWQEKTHKISPVQSNLRGNYFQGGVFYRSILFRRPSSPNRANTDPRFMHSTVSFRAKSPVRQKKKPKKKKIPFITGNDNHNVAPFAYTQDHIKGSYNYVLTTHYKQIFSYTWRQRINWRNQRRANNLWTN